MQGDATQRWYGCFRSEGEVRPHDAMLRKVRSRRRWAFGVVPLFGFGFSCFFVGIFTDCGRCPEIDAMVWVGLGAMASSVILLPFAAANVRAGGRLMAGETLERFTGVAATRHVDRVTRQLRRAGRIALDRETSLLVLPSTGHLVAVDGRVPLLFVRGHVSETAALTPLTERMLAPTERVEVQAELGARRRFDLMIVLFFSALIATTLYACLALYGPTRSAAGIVGLGAFGLFFCALFFPLAATTRGEEQAVLLDLERPLRIEGGTLLLAETGLVWQDGDVPGPMRLNHGGLLARNARRASGTPSPF